MNDIARTPPSEPLTADAGRWIGRVVIAVILAEGIWGLIVSLTNNLVLPLMATAMGADARSPLYLGKPDINVPGLFTSVLELCFAGIAFVIMSAWINRRPKVTRSKPVRISPLPVQPVAPAPLRTVVAPVNPPTTVATAPVASQPAVPSSVASAPSGQSSSQPEATRPQSAAPPPVKPAKPTAPKPVYYNSVGEPINPTEDE